MYYKRYLKQVYSYVIDNIYLPSEGIYYLCPDMHVLAKARPARVIKNLLP